MSKEKPTNQPKKAVLKSDAIKQAYIDKVSEETQKEIAKIRLTIYNGRRK